MSNSLPNSIKLQRVGWYSLYALNWLIILWFWWSGSGADVTSGLNGFLIAFGRLAGLTASYLILLQFFFMGRLPWLERVFGFDKLASVHSTNGKWGLLFLIVHPVLLTLGYSASTNTTLWAQTISFLTDYQHVAWAAVGLGLFMIVVATSITIARSRFRYESWYFVHLLVYLAVFASFWHQISVGTDLVLSRTFYWYWIILYIVVFTNHIAFRVGWAIYEYRKHQFYVSRVVRENYNTVSVYIAGRDLDKFNIYPGQFMILRFFAPGLWWQQHPFSLSRLPDGKELRVTIKELGDFTKQMAQLKVGTKLIIGGPYGVFTEFFSVSPKVLFIAGGIGITPIRSLMEQMMRHKKDTLLLYANKTEQDIVFKEELEKINARVTHIISDDPNFAGEKGRLDAEKIKRLVPDLHEREVFLCGPPPMMEAVVKTLRELGVPKPRIHYERFAL